MTNQKICGGFNSTGRREFIGFYTRVTGRKTSYLASEGSTVKLFFEALASHAEHADFRTGKNLVIKVPFDMTLSGRDEYFVLRPQQMEFFDRAVLSANGGKP